MSPGAVRVLVAPDKFKGTLTAEEASAAITRGLRAVQPDVEVREIPVADGGEGTIEALIAAGARVTTVDVDGPIEGMTVPARVAVLGRTAFVESAQACGLQLLTPTPATSLAAGSRGVGQMVLAALDAGCEHLVVGLGGVACTDGGAGLAHPLGIALCTVGGDAVPPGGAGLLDLDSVSTTGRDPRLRHMAVSAACDVTNPLVGPEGAAHVYGPQKGAGPREVRLLDRALRRYARVLARDLGADVSQVPGGGAAGGLAAGLVALLGAEITSGADLLLELLGFGDAVRGVDLVITGEGRLDAQSLSGKAPVAVAGRAARAGVPTLALAGTVELDDPRRTPFGAVWSMVEQAGADRALSDAAETLSLTAAHAYSQWAATT